jgi:hypothetical protein
MAGPPVLGEACCWNDDVDRGWDEKKSADEEEEEEEGAEGVRGDPRW